jgi:hypothetical protein
MPKRNGEWNVKTSLQQELVEAGLHLGKVIARAAKQTPELFIRENGKWCVEFRNPASGEFLTVIYSCPTKPVDQAVKN